MLLIDLDPQGNLSMSQGINPDTTERSMFDVLVHRLPIAEVIHPAEVDLAVSSIDLAGAELALSSMIGRERALEKALVEVKGNYDYVLGELTKKTGGPFETTLSFMGVDAALRKITAQLRGQYRLSYATLPELKNRKIEVKVARPGVKARIGPESRPPRES